jgi:hypothetical protein
MSRQQLVRFLRKKRHKPLLQFGDFSADVLDIIAEFPAGPGYPVRVLPVEKTMTALITGQARVEQNMEWQLRGELSVSVSKTDGDAFLEGVAVINFRDGR